MIDNMCIACKHSIANDEKQKQTKIILTSLMLNHI